MSRGTKAKVRSQNSKVKISNPHGHVARECIRDGFAGISQLAAGIKKLKTVIRNRPPTGRVPSGVTLSPAKAGWDLVCSSVPRRLRRGYLPLRGKPSPLIITTEPQYGKLSKLPITWHFSSINYFSRLGMLSHKRDCHRLLQPG